MISVMHTTQAWVRSQKADELKRVVASYFWGETTHGFKEEIAKIRFLDKRIRQAKAEAYEQYVTN